MQDSVSIQNHIGRFAPSPTGPLHIGSLLAALGSYLQAKHHHGKWLVRIEDLDPPREVAGAADDILRTLEYFHLYWDDEVVYQSQRHALYADTLDVLQQSELIYPCTCSRKIIQQNARNGPLGIIYPGTCRQQKLPQRSRHSLRLIVPDEPITFLDGLMGKISLNLRQAIGDVNLFRADGFYAYHLAVVVDDQDQHVSEIVRGSDLLFATPLHIYLQGCLGANTPSYLHLPVLENRQGEKLSKQTGAQAIRRQQPKQTILYLLRLLGQEPAEELASANLDEILDWAISHWNIATIPKNNLIIDGSQH